RSQRARQAKPSRSAEPADQLAAQCRRAEAAEAALAAMERHAETAIATAFRVAALLMQPEQLADLKLLWFEAMCEIRDVRGGAPNGVQDLPDRRADAGRPEAGRGDAAS
ncbi:MAG: hypothetical protein AB1716_25015, partial [Planctomycetota bacterium]